MVLQNLLDDYALHIKHDGDYGLGSEAQTELVCAIEGIYSQTQLDAINKLLE